MASVLQVAACFWSSFECGLLARSAVFECDKTGGGESAAEKCFVTSFTKKREKRAVFLEAVGHVCAGPQTTTLCFAHVWSNVGGSLPPTRYVYGSYPPPALWWWIGGLLTYNYSYLVSYLVSYFLTVTVHPAPPCGGGMLFSLLLA